MADLHCPHCGYNLRGLPEDRCPECGNPFDRDALARGDVRVYPPISLGEAVWRLFWPPAICALSSLNGCLFIFTFALLMIYGLLNAWSVAHRIAVTRQWRSVGTGRASPSGWQVEICCLFLWSTQLLVAMFGAVIVRLVVEP